MGCVHRLAAFHKPTALMRRHNVFLTRRKLSLHAASKSFRSKGLSCLVKQSRTRLENQGHSQTYAHIDRYQSLIEHRFLKGVRRGWRAGLVVKSTSYSRRGPKVCFQHLHGGPQLPVTSVLGDLRSSSDFLGHQAGMWCTNMKGKTVVHIK